jgi:hypothetical protein
MPAEISPPERSHSIIGLSLIAVLALYMAGCFVWALFIDLPPRELFPAPLHGVLYTEFWRWFFTLGLPVGFFALTASQYKLLQRSEAEQAGQWWGVDDWITLSTIPFCVMTILALLIIWQAPIFGQACSVPKVRDYAWFVVNSLYASKALKASSVQLQACPAAASWTVFAIESLINLYAVFVVLKFGGAFWALLRRNR